MRLLILLILVLATKSVSLQEPHMNNVPGKAITLETLETMFENIEENPGWDTSSDLLWGYFFTHREPSKLEEAKAYLVSEGYHFVKIYLSDKEDPKEPDKYWLHVEKNETHSPKSLDARNDVFYIYANEIGLDSYDGMDVGPIEK